MRYAYYPGCSLHGTAREYDASARAACKLLGVELQEVKDWTCCGASAAHETDPLLGVALPAVNLAKIAEMGAEAAIPCAACYNRLRMAEEVMAEDAEKKARVEQVIGREIEGAPPVRHLVELFDAEEIAQRAVRRADGVRAACYYGCLLTRPTAATIDENVVNPTRLDRLMAACGLEPVEWPFKTECCGGGLALSRVNITRRLVTRLLDAAKACGAECMITACPLCHANLDLRQPEVEREYDRRFGMPVLYFTEVIALALGAKARELELGRHTVGVERVAEGFR